MKTVVVLAAHKPCALPDDPLYLPVQAGAAGHELFLHTGDNTGDNISHKNPFYCELTVLYWAWKNLDCDFLGLVHYRRLFRGRGRRPLTLSEAEERLSRCPILLPGKRHYVIETLDAHYRHTLDPAPLDEARRVISEKYPTYLPAFDKLKKRRSAHMFNMLIMRRDLLDSYCAFLFAVLADLEQRVDASQMDAFQARFPGRIGELLLDVWLQTEGCAYEELPVLYTEKVNWWKKGTGFLRAKFFGKKYEKSF